MSNNILFRCDAGSHIGGGHMIRCLAFANALKQIGFECSFLCNPQAWEFPALINSGFARIHQRDLTTKHFKWIIFDHYFLNANDERKFRPFCDKILVIDDLANRTHDCDVLVDFSPSRKAKDYDGLVPHDCKRCIGIEFLILRNEFFSNNQSKSFNDPKKIFVTMGSIDGKEKIPHILTFLEGYKDVLEINILMTCKTRTLEEVKVLAKQSKHNIILHIDIPNPIEIMKASDLAISAGGMTCLELLALQVPTLAIIVADNQIENVGYLNAHGYVKEIKSHNDLLTLNLKNMLQNPNLKKFETGKTLKIISEMI